MFRNTGANAFAKNQTRLAYEDKRDLYCISQGFTGLYLAKIEVDLTLSAIKFLSYTLFYYMSLVYEMPYWTS